MKPLLRFVLLAAISAIVSPGFLVGQGGLNIALSVVSGVAVLASAAGLSTLRGPRESLRTARSGLTVTADAL